MAKTPETVAAPAAPKEGKIYIILNEGFEVASVKEAIAQVTTSRDALVQAVTGENPRAVLTFKTMTSGKSRGPRKPKA